MMIYTEHVLNHEYYDSMIISKVLTKLLIIGITLVNMHKSLEYTTLTNMRPVFFVLKIVNLILWRVRMTVSESRNFLRS